MRFPRTGTTMSTRLGSLVAAVLLLSATACGGDDPLDVTADDLLGTWNITSLLYTPVAGGASVQGVQGGLSGTISFRADLTYTFSFQDSGPPPVSETEDGTFTVVGDVLTITPDNAPGDSSALEIQALSSNSATLFQADDEYDFDDDGTDEPSTTTVTLQR